MKKLLLILLCLPMLGISQNVGDFYQGGILYYVDNSGIKQKGLIIDTAYLESTHPWSTQDSLISNWGPDLHSCNGTEDESIGGGKQNTTSFEQDHPDSNYAANLCFHSNSGGFTDWFLPSIDELWQAMLNLNTIDSAIIINGGDIISTNFHWSSTQILDDSLGLAHGVWPHSSNGPFLQAENKNDPYLVRAIRCIDNDCSFLEPTVIQEHSTNKELLKITDLLGRETNKTNQPLFYIYDDGTVEKRIIIE